MRSQPVVQRSSFQKYPFTLGILTTPAKDIFHSNYHLGLLSGIQPRIKALKGKLKILMMPVKPYESLDQVLKENQLDGLMILTWRWIHPSIVKLIETTRHPNVLVVNDPVPGLRVNCVFTDVNDGMQQAVRHLSRRKFRKIGMLHGPWEVEFKNGKRKARVPFIDTQLKVKGLMRALKAAKFSCDRNWFRSGKANSAVEGYRVMTDWLKEEGLPEAIICGNDDLAFGALKAMKESGKRLAVIGFDDNEHAKSFSPPLTTLRQPLMRMGRDAVDTLRKHAACSGAPVLKKYLPELIIRKTA